MRSICLKASMICKNTLSKCQTHSCDAARRQSFVYVTHYAGSPWLQKQSEVFPVWPDERWFSKCVGFAYLWKLLDIRHTLTLLSQLGLRSWKRFTVELFKVDMWDYRRGTAVVQLPSSDRVYHLYSWFFQRAFGLDPSADLLQCVLFLSGPAMTSARAMLSANFSSAQSRLWWLLLMRRAVSSEAYISEIIHWISSAM